MPARINHLTKLYFKIAAACHYAAQSSLYARARLTLGPMCQHLPPLGSDQGLFRNECGDVRDDSLFPRRLTRTPRTERDVSRSRPGLAWRPVEIRDRAALPGQRRDLRQEIGRAS